MILGESNFRLYHSDDFTDSDSNRDGNTSADICNGSRQKIMRLVIRVEHMFE